MIWGEARKNLVDLTNCSSKLVSESTFKENHHKITRWNRYHVHQKRGETYRWRQIALCSWLRCLWVQVLFLQRYSAKMFPKVEARIMTKRHHEPIKNGLGTLYLVRSVWTNSGAVAFPDQKASIFLRNAFFQPLTSSLRHKIPLTSYFNKITSLLNHEIHKKSIGDNSLQIRFGIQVWTHRKIFEYYWS